MELNRQLVLGADAGDVLHLGGDVQPRTRVAAQKRHRGDHRRCRERLAVVKAHVWAESEHPGVGRRVFPAQGQGGLQSAAGVDLGEGIEQGNPES